MTDRPCRVAGGLSMALLACVSVIAVALFSLPASADIIPLGSSLTFGGTNAPDTYSANTTFSSTPVLVDNGKVEIWQNQVATAGGGEWDVFYMETTNGGPLAGDINAFWNIVISYDLSEPVYFDANVLQWSVNGDPVNPLYNFGGICCASSSNPILPGEAYYNSGFQVALPAGVQSDWEEVYVTPYNFVEDGGINPNTADDFTFALHFTPQMPTTPEPASVWLLGLGLLTVAFFQRKKFLARMFG
jgi:hypothetical protein